MLKILPEKLQLEVGKSYRTNDGEFVTVEYKSRISDNYQSSKGHWYTPDGLFIGYEHNLEYAGHICEEVITTVTPQGEPSKKFDEGKPRTDLLPPLALLEVAKVLGGGAVTYGDYNWKKNMRLGRLLGAALRHIFAWMSGEDKDESGLNPLAHAACDILMVLEYLLEGRTEFDTRYKGEKK